MVYLLSLMLGWTCMGIQNYVAAAQANNNFARTLQAVQAGSPNYSDITRAGAMANLENELLARQLEGDMVVNATNAHAAVSVGKARAAIEEGKVRREQERQRMAGRVAAQARRDRLMAMKPKRPEQYIPEPVVVAPDLTEEIEALKKKYGTQPTEAPSTNASNIQNPVISGIFSQLRPEEQAIFRKAYPELAPEPTVQELARTKRVANTSSQLMLSPTDTQSIIQSANNLQLDPKSWAALLYQESGFDPNITNKLGHYGLIQFGDSERIESGLDMDKYANRSYTIPEQLPVAERWMQGRGYRPGMGIQKAYQTIFGGNPNADLDKEDINNMSARKGAARMMPGGDLYNLMGQYGF